MVELAYTASLKLAAERHTGSNPVIPSDHIKSAQCEDGNTLCAYGIDGYDYEVRYYGGLARACEWPENTGGKPLRHMDFRGIGHILQAQQRCELWNEQRRCNRPN